MCTLADCVKKGEKCPQCLFRFKFLNSRSAIPGQCIRLLFQVSIESREETNSFHDEWKQAKLGRNLRLTEICSAENSGANEMELVIELLIDSTFI